jgi:hypothetical protein
MKIPILAGITADATPAIRAALPVNYVPVPPAPESGADGYLRPAEGIAAFTTGQGSDRGAIVWESNHYRVSGTKLIKVAADGTVTVIGTISGTDNARLDYSFDHLGIAADGKLWLYDGTTLTQVTDPDIGTVNDAVQVDGYWMVTDGTTLPVSDLADPFSYNPLKYGSTDAPDPVLGLLKVQNEVHVISRHRIDPFQNVGGSLFPFARVKEGLITKGAIGKRAACVFNDNVAFLGSGLNEAPSVYLGRNAQSAKIASHEVDELLTGYTETQLSAVIMEPVIDRGLELLFVHLSDRTLVYDAVFSKAAQQPMWHVRASTLNGFAQYRARNIVRASDAWCVGDPQSSAIGKWSTTSSQHYGTDVRWEFSTPMLRNGGKGAIVKQLELLALTGVVAVGKDPMISTAFSNDGKTYSQERSIRAGKIGETEKRLVWTPQGYWRNWRIQRFRGDSGAHPPVLQLDADIEALKN